MSEYISVVSPSGESFEVTPIRARLLVGEGWSYSLPPVELPGEPTFEEKLAGLDVPGLQELMLTDFKVIADRRLGRDRLVAALKKLQAQKTGSQLPLDL